MRLRHAIVVVGVVVACTHAALELSSRDHHVIALASGSADFGGVLIGSASPDHTFTVGPAGSAFQDDTVFTVTGCQNFRVVSLTTRIVGGSGSGVGDGSSFPVYRRCTLLPDGGSGYGGCLMTEDSVLDIVVRFEPTARGLRTCNLQVTGTSSLTIPLQGTGRLPDHDYQLQPLVNKLEFNAVRVQDTSDPKTITIKNAGELELSVTASVTGAGFSLSSGNGAAQKLPFAGQDAYSVTCSPGNTTGPLTGMLTITTDADDVTKSTLNLMLSCTGINSDVDVAPNQVPPFLVRVNETAQQVLTLTNDRGTATAIIESVTLSGNNGQLTLVNPPAPNTSLDPGDPPLQFTVNYAPTAGFHGTAGTLTIKIQNEDDRVFDILADATSSIPRANPEALDFGSICVQQSASKQIIVHAEGDATFRVESIQLSGPTGVPFTATAVLPGDVKPLPDQQDLLIDVLATPTTEGDFDQTLTIETDSTTQPADVAVNLKVKGLPPGVTVDPVLVPFARTQVPRPANPKTTRFTNCTLAPVAVHQIRLDGADAADFGISSVRYPVDGVLVTADPPFELAPVGQVEVDVYLEPKSEGNKVAQLVVDYGADENRAIDLTGEGFLPEPGRDSYYRCGCGTGSAAQAWPLAAMVWLVVRRKKRRYASGSDGRRTQDRDRSDPRR